MSKYYDDIYKMPEYDALLYTNKKSKKKTWSVRIKIRGKSGYIVKSCKTDKLHLAIEFAKKLANRTHQITSAGLDPSRSHKFNDVFEQFLQNHRENGTLSRYRLKSLTGDYERYFSDYFSDYDIQDITSPVWSNFKIWRRNYWTKYTPGADENGLVNVVKAKPKNATLRMCRTNFTQFLQWCLERGYLNTVPVIRPFDKNSDEVKTRGAPFERTEWARLASRMREDAFEESNPKLKPNHFHQRRVIYYSSLFMVGTLMRPSEVFQLRWKDLRWTQNRYNSEDEDLIVLVPKEISKVRKSRTAIGTCSVANHMRHWKSISKFGSSKDYIFPKWSGERLQTTNKTFVKRCKELNILFSDNGVKRTLYSCRHTGITFALRRGISEIDVANLAGTSINYIQQNYYKTTAEKRSSEFATQYVPPREFAGFDVDDI